MKRIYSIVLAAAVIFGLSPVTVLAQEKTSYEVEYQTPQGYKDFRFSIGGGYAFRLGKIEKTGDTKVDDLNKKLRHGYTVDADAQYFFKEGWGLGLNVNYCSSSTSGSNIDIPEYGNANSYKESQNVLFVGPSFAGRNETDRFLLVSSFAIGPMFYMDKMTIDGRLLDGTKTTMGFNAGVAGEYKLNAKTGIGLKLSYTLGTINSINLEGQNVEYDEPASISNLMATVFLSFRSW
ncbi:outer membrane beta-barrel protein [uncultured Proteiniphilum sp.]|uniref:outer membrane beta-barrel protein n=1 Tax=uncultured Proteiniphilum sp. TaxID=497637 RepID=UPI002606B5DF|nr:outer membrane beta-barrel protein [uncultured Proteiniphilum sp.]